MGLQRTSETLSEVSRSSGEVVFTFSVVNATELAPAPLASGVLTVRKSEACTGGVQDANAKGAESQAAVRGDATVNTAATSWSAWPSAIASCHRGASASVTGS